jgi:hypothetical protein
MFPQGFLAIMGGLSFMISKKLLKKSSSFLFFVYFAVFLLKSNFFLFANEKITVLTNPIGTSNNANWGHYAVTRSLINGFEKLKIDWNFNPSKIEDVGQIVCVLSNVDALYQAISLKKNGVIKKILVGPNIMNRTNDYNGVLGSPEIDVYLVPSEWVKKPCLEDNPALNGRIEVWYAGVDANRYLPLNNEAESSDVLIYWKSGTSSFIYEIQKTLKAHGYKPTTIVYGQYTMEQYIDILKKVSFAVFVSESESQGIALAEAWAANVPTLCWNPKKPITWLNKIYFPVSSCPYMNNELGLEWETIKDLKLNILAIKNRLVHFSPRQWVLNHLTDEKSALLLLEIAYKERNKH